MKYKLHERRAGYFTKLPIPVFIRPVTSEEVGKQVGTREGITPIIVSDWIVTGVEGEVYPISADVLAKTYELASKLYVPRMPKKAGLAP